MTTSEDTPRAAPAVPDVLFLCTANFYRSRFAHLYFNHLARDTALRADSRGLLVGHYSSLRGLSPMAETVLRQMQVPISAADRRNPLQVTKAEVRTVPRVIAMYQTEHEPMAVRVLGELAARIDYWHVPDVDEAMPTRALLSHCRGEVESLLARLLSDAGEGRKPSHGSSGPRRSA